MFGFAASSLAALQLHPSSGGLHSRTAARAPSPVAASFATTAEFYWLKDRLMEQTVKLQMDRFRYLGDLAQSMWLNQAWREFLEEEKNEAKRKEKMGDDWQFLVELQRRSEDMISVPTGGGFRQGSPGNPYIKPRLTHRVELVRPQSVAKRLVSVREQLAEEWSGVLQLLGTGEPHEAHPNERLLHTTATRVAVREVIDDVSKAEAEFLRKEMGSLALSLGPSAAKIDCEALLNELAARPLVVTGTSLIDPPVMSEQIRQKCKEVELDLAEPVLATTLADHRELHCAFLDSCLVRDED